MADRAVDCEFPVSGLEFWVPGVPATFATAKEGPWRETLSSHLPACPQQDGRGLETVVGLVADFVLQSLAPAGQPLDVDNLCAPVFSVLVNEKGWFEARRPNIQWWQASKREGEPTGVRLLITTLRPPDFREWFGRPVLDGTYAGKLPTSSSDPEIPNWLRAMRWTEPTAGRVRFALRVGFGNAAVNLGNIETGKVKPVIDCLHPVVGWDERRRGPEDWRIDILQVAKGEPGLGNSPLKISVWEMKQGAV